MSRVVCLLLSLFCIAALAADMPIPEGTAAQMKRMEPLNKEKVDVFVISGQISREQADFVMKHVDGNGRLNLPNSAIASARPAPPREPGPPPARRVSPPPAPREEPRERRQAERSDNPYASFGYKLKHDDRQRLTKLIHDFRYGDHADIGRELREFRPEVNELIAESYPDPIDLHIKVALWDKVAGPKNPDAAFGLFETHKAAYLLARPILIAYAKDVGGALVRRRSTSPVANPMQRFFTSRELREMIVDIEGIIARCPGANSAKFLMDVYSERYTDGPVPMRDKGRDRHRMVEACGGDPRKFDQDEPHTWSSSLSEPERREIAKHLAPWLHRNEEDRRRIAKNGLMVCVSWPHPAWDAGRVAWEKWSDETR